MPQANLPFAGAGALLVLLVVAGCAQGRLLQHVLSLGPRRVDRSPNDRCRRGGGRGLLGDDGALLGRGVLNDVELLGQSRSGQGEQQSCSEYVSTHGILLFGRPPTPKLDSKFRPSRPTLDRPSEFLLLFERRKRRPSKEYPLAKFVPRGTVRNRDRLWQLYGSSFAVRS